jgi:hypothetical protein
VSTGNFWANGSEDVSQPNNDLWMGRARKVLCSPQSASLNP